MKRRSISNIAIVVGLFFGALFLYLFLRDPHPGNAKRAVKIIVAEAADQNFTGKVAVAEVIRRRGSTKGFSSAKKDLDKFFREQPQKTQDEARLAWLLSRFTNVSRGADHFDNVKKFGEPSWAKAMTKTVVIDDMQYYKSPA